MVAVELSVQLRRVAESENKPAGEFSTSELFPGPFGSKKKLLDPINPPVGVPSPNANPNPV